MDSKALKPRASKRAGYQKGSQPAGIQPTVIDQAALDAIRALQQPGAEDLLAKITSLYCQDAARLTACIATAIEISDSNAVREAAHSLKSSSANLGATRVASLSRDLEHLGRSGELHEADMLFMQLTGELHYALAELKALAGIA